MKNLVLSKEQESFVRQALYDVLFMLLVDKKMLRKRNITMQDVEVLTDNALKEINTYLYIQTAFAAIRKGVKTDEAAMEKAVAEAKKIIS